MAASIRQTLRRVRVRPGERVLDVGCGTGDLLRAVADAAPDAQLAGIDLSPQMLEVAELKLGDKAEFRLGQAEALPFENASFSLVVSTSVFHFVRQPAQALDEMRRVLIPSGVLVTTDWCDDYLLCKACDLYLRLFNRAYVRAYKLAECERLLMDAGFTAVDADRYKINWLWGMMTVRGNKP